MPPISLASSRSLAGRQSSVIFVPRRWTSLQVWPPSSQHTVCKSLALVPQRSPEWFALRQDKLTASTFSIALGFWRGNRRAELWHQKVFAPDSIALVGAAKAAMDWGILHEPEAFERYTSITGREVASFGFATHAEAHSEWLGASPDGVIGSAPDGGILEVKCPYNGGRPDIARPWKAVPYYNIPQVQGQMEILGREWVDLYCWTLNGSVVFRVCRDRAYWQLIHGVLHDFWWGNVVPAREALLLGKEDEARAFKPRPKHDLTKTVVCRSRQLAAKAKLLCRDVGGHVELFN